METSQNLILHPGKDISTSLVPDSHVNRTVLPEVEELPKESSTPGTSGPKHERSFGWWDQNGSCLRTYQASFLEMTDGRVTGSQFLESFPSWGLMLGGEFIARPTLEHPILGNGGGSWPTPNTSDSYNANMKDGHDLTKGYLRGVVHHIPTPTTADVYTGKMKSSQQSDGSMHSVTLPDYVEMFPTPTATIRHNDVDATPSEQTIQRYKEGKIARIRKTRAPTLSTYIEKEHEIRWATPTGEDAKNTPGPGREKRHGPMLNLQVTKWPTPTGDDANNVTRASGDFQSLSREAQLWPTPNASGGTNTGISAETAQNELIKGNQIGLGAAAALWPTPATSQDYKPVRPLIPSEAGGTHNTMLVGAVGDVEPENIGGSLNPDWVEQHLMSLPEGWTRLEPVPDGAYDEWFDAMRDGTWWDTERGLPRVTTGAENRVNRLKMLGNGIVPATLALFLEAESDEYNF